MKFKHIAVSVCTLSLGLLQGVPALSQGDPVPPVTPPPQTPQVQTPIETPTQPNLLQIIQQQQQIQNTIQNIQLPSYLQTNPTISPLDQRSGLASQSTTMPPSVTSLTITTKTPTIINSSLLAPSDQVTTVKTGSFGQPITVTTTNTTVSDIKPTSTTTTSVTSVPTNVQAIKTTTTSSINSKPSFDSLGPLLENLAKLQSSSLQPALSDIKIKEIGTSLDTVLKDFSKVHNDFVSNTSLPGSIVLLPYPNPQNIGLSNQIFKNVYDLGQKISALEKEMGSNPPADLVKKLDQAKTKLEIYTAKILTPFYKYMESELNKLNTDILNTFKADQSVDTDKLLDKYTNQLEGLKGVLSGRSTSQLDTLLSKVQDTLQGQKNTAIAAKEHFNRDKSTKEELDSAGNSLKEMFTGIGEGFMKDVGKPVENAFTEIANYIDKPAAVGKKTTNTKPQVPQKSAQQIAADAAWARGDYIGSSAIWGNVPSNQFISGAQSLGNINSSINNLQNQYNQVTSQLKAGGPPAKIQYLKSEQSRLQGELSTLKQSQATQEKAVLKIFSGMSTATGAKLLTNAITGKTLSGAEIQSLANQYYNAR